MLWRAAGLFLSGLGYLLGSHPRVEAGRILQGNLFGSPVVASGIVSLLALGFLVLALMSFLFERRHGRAAAVVPLLLVLVPLCWLGEAAARV
jgi:hypothetical protein